MVGNTTGSIPDPSNTGYTKRDKRRKGDVEHMYRRNLLAKAIDILNRKKLKEANSSSKYVIYHDTYTSAIQAAEKYATSQGYELDKEEMSDKIGMGPKKPAPGKTNKISLTLMKDGKAQKKMFHIQVYNRETSSNTYELNCYIA